MSGSTELDHRVLVTDIVDEVILVMETMNAYGFIVNFTTVSWESDKKRWLLSTARMSETLTCVINHRAGLYRRTLERSSWSESMLWIASIHVRISISQHIAQSLAIPHVTGSVEVSMVNIIFHITKQLHLCRIAFVAWGSRMIQG